MARFVISIFIFVFCTDLRSAPRLDRLNLLQFRDAKGKIQPVKTTVDWELRRTEILKGMVAVMGPLPGKARRVRLDVKVEEEVDAGKYFRQLITFQSEPGSRTPAYLCIPKPVFIVKGGTAPAVLCASDDAAAKILAQRHQGTRFLKAAGDKLLTKADGIWVRGCFAGQ